jgi:cell division septal protein FtsQ
MRRKYKSLLGSQRSSFFKEAKSRPEKFRSQRVKFRRRYATSLLTTWGVRVWALTKVLLVLGIVGLAVLKGQSFWETSRWLKIAGVQFVKPPTPALRAFLDIQPGDNIMDLKPNQLEKAGMAKFKQLKNLKIGRRLTRHVVVDFEYRTPFALLEVAGKNIGVDATGVVFPIDELKLTEPLPPTLAGFSPSAELSGTMAALSTIQKEVPEFYSLIKILKTDRMQPLRVVLKNDVVIYWGEMESSNVVGRTENILKVLSQFTPKKSFASLRFVTDDRLVMDSQWMPKK